MFKPNSFKIYSRTSREKAEARLQVYGAEKHYDMGRAFYGVQRAVATGRLTGTAAMAVRAMTGYQLAKLVCEIANQGMSEDEAFRFINRQYAA